MGAFPRKAEGLEINEVADGYIVYQKDRDRVHYLNLTAALVLELCTGENDADQFPALIKEAYSLAESPGSDVQECLERFTAEGLIQ